MKRRHLPTQRLFAWLALVAMGLAALAPVVSQLCMRPSAHMAMSMPMPMDDMAMGSWCEGHAQPPDHGGMVMDACAYCAFLAHHYGLPSVPVVVMRPPVGLAQATLPPLPAPRLALPGFFDAAPRGPPFLA